MVLRSDQPHGTTVKRIQKRNPSNNDIVPFRGHGKTQRSLINQENNNSVLRRRETRSTPELLTERRIDIRPRTENGHRFSHQMRGV